MENTPLDLYVGKEQAKNTPQSLFKIDGYLADLRSEIKVEVHFFSGYLRTTNTPQFFTHGFWNNNISFYWDY